MEQAVWNVCFVTVSAAASTCRKASSCEIVRLRGEQGGWWGGVVLGGPGYHTRGYRHLRPGIIQPDVKLDTGEGAGGASLAPAGACEIERVHAEWLVVVRCDANDVCLERVLRKSSV